MTEHLKRAACAAATDTFQTPLVVVNAATRCAALAGRTIAAAAIAEPTTGAVVASKPMCRYGFYPKYVGSTPAGGNQASNYVGTAA